MIKKSQTKIIKPKKSNTGKMKAIKKEVDGIVFHSTLEANYYEHLVKKKSEGEVLLIELQPRFLLLDEYKKYGRIIKKIEYISDFKVTYADGSVIIEDTKGIETKDFIIKRKMFDYRYPDLTLKLIAYDKSLGWIDYDELKKIKQKNRREKNKLNKSKKGDAANAKKTPSK